LRDFYVVGIELLITAPQLIWSMLLFPAPSWLGGVPLLQLSEDDESSPGQTEKKETCPLKKDTDKNERGLEMYIWPLDKLRRLEGSLRTLQIPLHHFGSKLQIPLLYWPHVLVDAALLLVQYQINQTILSQASTGDAYDTHTKMSLKTQLMSPTKYLIKVLKHLEQIQEYEKRQDEKKQQHRDKKMQNTTTTPTKNIKKQQRIDYERPNFANLHHIPPILDRIPYLRASVYGPLGLLLILIPPVDPPLFSQCNLSGNYPSAAHLVYNNSNNNNNNNNNSSNSNNIFKRDNSKPKDSIQPEKQKKSSDPIFSLPLSSLNTFHECHTLGIQYIHQALHIYKDAGMKIPQNWLEDCLKVVS
jgi:hypothetical protein